MTSDTTITINIQINKTDTTTPDEISTEESKTSEINHSKKSALINYFHINPNTVEIIQDDGLFDVHLPHETQRYWVATSKERFQECERSLKNPYVLNSLTSKEINMMTGIPMGSIIQFYVDHKHLKPLDFGNQLYNFINQNNKFDKLIENYTKNRSKMGELLAGYDGFEIILKENEPTLYAYRVE